MNDKLKKVMLGMLVQCIAVLFVVATSSAIDIKNLTVVQTGAKGDGVGSTAAMTLTRTATSQACGDWAVGAERWYYFVTGMDDAGLATLLTALSLGKTVEARFVNATCNNASTISLIKIIQ